MPDVTARLNPVRSTVTVYVPSTSGGDVYTPAVLVTSAVSTPVASFRIVTVAPGTPEPCASVTTPLRMARSARCARTGRLTLRLEQTTIATTRETTRQVLLMPTSGRGSDRAAPVGPADCLPEPPVNIHGARDRERSRREKLAPQSGTVKPFLLMSFRVVRLKPDTTDVFFEPAWRVPSIVSGFSRT